MEAIDPSGLGGATSNAQLYKDGHEGLLTINSDDPVDSQTTYRHSYKPPTGPNGGRGMKSYSLVKESV